jgi:putative nucleotidyltransferase with HDIG domain
MRKLPGYGYDSKDLWKHSLSVALASKLIAERKNNNLVNEAHTAGLIHDIGKVVLDNHVQKYWDQIDHFMKEEEKTFLDAEHHFFGFDHAEVGSDICRKWNIPENISHGIKCHHQPSISDQDELSYILHMADYIAMMAGIGYDDDDTLYQPEEGTMDFLGLRQNGVGEIMLKVMESINKL